MNHCVVFSFSILPIQVAAFYPIFIYASWLLLLYITDMKKSRNTFKESLRFLMEYQGTTRPFLPSFYNVKEPYVHIFVFEDMNGSSWPQNPIACQCWKFIRIILCQGFKWGSVHSLSFNLFLVWKWTNYLSFLIWIFYFE